VALCPTRESEIELAIAVIKEGKIGIALKIVVNEIQQFHQVHDPKKNPEGGSLGFIGTNFERSTEPPFLNPQTNEVAG
jgi:hypothetical protein